MDDRRPRAAWSRSVRDRRHRPAGDRLRELAQSGQVIAHEGAGIARFDQVHADRPAHDEIERDGHSRERRLLDEDLGPRLPPGHEGGEPIQGCDQVMKSPATPVNGCPHRSVQPGKPLQRRYLPDGGSGPNPGIS